MRQDIRESVRPIIYQTDFDDFPYSHGGSLFLVNYGGKCFGLTYRHVLGLAGVNHLFVAPAHFPAIGMRPATIKKLMKINGQDNDLQEIAVICFTDEIGPDFFGGTAYIIDLFSVGTSDTAHRLRVHGFLSTKTLIDCDARSITGGYCDLQFHDVGPTSSDPFVRQALATYAGHDFSSLDGISGAPVFDETTNKLCGMVVRAGLSKVGKASLWYIDIFHIVNFLHAAYSGSSKLNYMLPPHSV